MKTALASLILTLVAYAQACCADTMNLTLFKSQNNLLDYKVSKIQPTWLFGSQGSTQLMGFTQVITTQYIQERHNTTDNVVGVGLHQQVTPFMYTQILISDESNGHCAVKVGFDF